MSAEPEHITKGNHRGRRAIHLAALGTMTAIAGLALSAAVLSSRHPEYRRELRVAISGKHELANDHVVRQQHPNDCGPAVLTMLLRAKGKDVSLQGLTQEMELSPEGASMANLLRTCRRHGLPVECGRIGFHELKEIPLPAVAFVRGNHFVLVESVDDDGNLVIADPASGRARVMPWRFRLIWGGAILRTS